MSPTSIPMTAFYHVIVSAIYSTLAACQCTDQLPPNLVALIIYKAIMPPWDHTGCTFNFYAIGFDGTCVITMVGYYTMCHVYFCFDFSHFICLLCLLLQKKNIVLNPCVLRTPKRLVGCCWLSFQCSCAETTWFSAWFVIYSMSPYPPLHPYESP